MRNYQTISIIGSGNLATNLAVALESEGHTVAEIYSRNPDHAEVLVSRLYDAVVQPDLDFSESKSRIFIISVKDSEIGYVADQLVIPDEDCIVVHTSGSVSIDVLGSFFDKCGVLYPLQTFTREKLIKFRNIPMLVEGSNKRVTRELKELAKSLSKMVEKADSSQRLVTHLAAVFSSNFSNHLLSIAKELMDHYDLDYQILSPLIQETVEKGLSIGPEQTQTGPARRKDHPVINKHLELLNDDPELQEIYRKISEHIIRKYS